MKKVLVMIFLLVWGISFSQSAKLDLRNGDVLHCLVSAASHDGWKLISIYTNVDGKRVVVFTKGKNFKKYEGIR